MREGTLTMTEGDAVTRGWWNMACWNGLSRDQQQQLLTEGVLPWGYEPEGLCTNGAEVAVESQWDKAAGPRFYCIDCARAYLAKLRLQEAEARVIRDGVSDWEARAFPACPHPRAWHVLRQDGGVRCGKCGAEL